MVTPVASACRHLAKRHASRIEQRAYSTCAGSHLSVLSIPRHPSNTHPTPTHRCPPARARSDAGNVVGQITQLVAANETLKLENAQLLAVNEQLRAQLAEIGTTLGRLTGGPRRGRGRRGAEMAVLAEAKPKRTRKPITDPEQLERRKQALAKARAVRAEKLAAAREGSASGG